MRPPWSLLSFTQLYIPLILAAACAGPQIAQKALPVGAAAPMPRPEAYLYVDQFPLEPEGTSGHLFKARLVSAGYQSVREDDGLAEDMTYTLDFQEPRVRDEVVPPFHRLAIVAGAKMVPRLQRGKEYAVTYFYHDRGMFLPPSLGVVIKNPLGRVEYFLSADEAVPPSQLPEGISLLPSRKTAYSTTRATAAGCTIQKRHFFVEVISGEARTSLAPGETKIVRTASGRYRVTLFDCSVSDTEVDCLVEDPPHFSILLEAIEFF
jgi:hypothetical protein